jgi:uncharacterized protein (TIGR02145 family)
LTNILPSYDFVVVYENIPTYAITVSSGTGVLITPPGSISAPEGSSPAFTFSAQTGYNLTSVLVDGQVNSTALAAGSYTFLPVSATHTLNVTATLKTYPITVTSGAGGTMSPAANQVANHGSTPTFIATATTGNRIKTLSVDGVAISAAVGKTSYTYMFSAVTAARTIAVTFETIPAYAITATAGTGVVMTPPGSVSAPEGSSPAFAFSAQTGYNLTSVLVDGLDNSTALAAGSYTFALVSAPHTLVVTATLKTYPITVTTGAGGTMSPAANQVANHGSTPTFTFTPNAGYGVDKVLVDGKNEPAAVTNKAYTFSSVTAAHTIQVSFIDLCTVSTTVLTGTNSITDCRNRQTYNTVVIGTQTWMAKNLNYGTLTTGVASNNAIVEKNCTSNLEANCTTDGGFYSWAEALGLPSSCNASSCAASISVGNHQGICPTSWHIPKAAEFTTLSTFLGTATAGTQMKTTTGWTTNTGTNSSGFSALPAAYYGGTSYIGDYAFFWSTGESSTEEGYSSLLFKSSATLTTSSSRGKTTGFSVRCLKD